MSTLELSQSSPGPLRMPAQTVELPRLPAVSSVTDSAIRASTEAVVLAVAGIAAYISYLHAYAVVRQYGESGVTALLEPGTIDGLVYASSMVILHAPGTGCRFRGWPAGCSRSASLPRSPSTWPRAGPRPGRRGSGSLARSRAGGILRNGRLDDPDHGPRRTGPRALIGPRPSTAGPARAQPAACSFPDARGRDGGCVG
jgi:hypothetical protein